MEYMDAMQQSRHIAMTAERTARTHQHGREHRRRARTSQQGAKRTGVAPLVGRDAARELAVRGVRLDLPRVRVRSVLSDRVIRVDVRPTVIVPSSG